MEFCMPLAIHTYVASYMVTSCIPSYVHVSTSGSGLKSLAAIAGSAIQTLVYNVNKVLFELVSFDFFQNELLNTERP